VLAEGVTVHLAAGLVNKTVVRLECSENILKPIWAKQFPNVVPRSVTFIKNHDLLVLGLFDGMAYVPHWCGDSLLILA
jgi:hypothetical protein